MYSTDGFSMCVRVCVRANLQKVSVYVCECTFVRMSRCECESAHVYECLKVR